MNRLKRWESPRRKGRNDKGKGGSARARQLKKREKLLRKNLKKSRDFFFIIMTKMNKLKTVKAGALNKDDYIRTCMNKGYFRDVLTAGKSYDNML